MWHSAAPPGRVGLNDACHGFRPPMADSTRGYIPRPLTGPQKIPPEVSRTPPKHVDCDSLLDSS